MKCSDTEQDLDALIRDLKEARARLVDLLAALDDINLREIPQVKIAYSLKIGVWEAELAKAELEARKAKEIYRIVRERANRGVKASLDETNEIVERQLAQWVKTVNIKLMEVNSSMEKRAITGTLTAVDAHELKKLHRRLVRRLHPDLNSSNPDSERLFYLVQTAYEKGDVDFLRALDVSTMDAESAEAFDGATAQSIYLDIELANAQAAVVIERIEEAKASNPYIYREVLDDPAWVEAKVAPMKAQIEELKEAQDAYMKKVNQVMEEFDGE